MNMNGMNPNMMMNMGMMDQNMMMGNMGNMPNMGMPNMMNNNMGMPNMMNNNMGMNDMAGMMGGNMGMPNMMNNMGMPNMMNNMGMPNMMNNMCMPNMMNNMGMPNMMNNVGTPEAQKVSIEDATGWNLIFENQNDRQQITVTISEQKLVKEAISAYLLKANRTDKCKFIFNNKELFPEMKICQSGLSNMAKILVISIQNLKGAY